MVVWIILIPLVFAGLCLVLPGSLTRRLTLVAGTGAHLAAVAQSWRAPLPPVGSSLLAFDPLGHLLITLISVLFLAVAVYFVGYHQKALLSQRIFLACVLALLSTLSLVCASQHLGVLWVGLETASLAATPLIYFRLGPRALEATWKFLLMNSVGIGLALLGTFCLAISGTGVKGEMGLTVGSLVTHAAQLDPAWLRSAFLLAMVGFGTKMGLAPLHSWKPDAYGEAPPPVSALLAGGMTLGAFLGILRFLQIVLAAGQGEFACLWMSVFGLLSIATAAVFIVGNNDYRRILAYTSVEHMGVLVLGMGLGVAGSYPSLLHALHNTLNKGVLFLMAGFLWRMYQSNRISDVRGTIHRHRVAGLLLLLGLCATCGLPPFGMFYSELGIVIAAVRGSHWVVAGLFVLTLTAVFVGAMTALLPMILGQPTGHRRPARDESRQSGPTGETPMPPSAWRQPVMLVPVVALLLIAFGLSMYQPAPVKKALEQAAATVTAPQFVVRASAREFRVQRAEARTTNLEVAP